MRVSLESRETKVTWSKEKLFVVKRVIRNVHISCIYQDSYRLRLLLRKRCDRCLARVFKSDTTRTTFFSFATLAGFSVVGPGIVSAKSKSL